MVFVCWYCVSEDEVKEGAQLDAGFVRECGGPWLTIVGLCDIMDPPRPECVDAIIEAHRAGVCVAMIVFISIFRSHNSSNRYMVAFCISGCS